MPYYNNSLLMILLEAANKIQESKYKSYFVTLLN